MENQEQAVQTEAQQSAPELSINDLKNLRIIVDTAVRRGAFSAVEASSVGAAFDRLNVFLNSVSPETQPAAQAPATAQAPAA